MNILEKNVIESEDDELDFDFDLNFDPESFIDEDYQESSPVEVKYEEVTQFARVKRYHRPRVVAFEYAEKLAEDIGILEEGDCVFALLSGNFISGDFIEAYLTKHNLFAETLIIATLSLSKNNVDSLKNLQIGGYIGQLGLLVSDYFFSHERRNITEYVIAELANGDFHFAAAGLHTKIALIKTSCGQHLLIHGSANLRSSRNLEQVIIENNRILYDYNENWMSDLLQRFPIDHKRLRGDKLWQAVAE